MIIIPTKNKESISVSFYNEDTNECISDFNDIEEINFTCESRIDCVYGKYNRKLSEFKYDPTYCITFEPNNPVSEDFYKILGIDKTNIPDAYDIRITKFIQVRKHKKKRINKKWIKRYGYKQVMVNCKGYNIKCDTDGNVKFVK